MDDHTHIGQTSHGKPVALTRDERLRHMAIFGSTGVGKTTFLLNIVAQDIARGDGLLVIDPHGDFAEKALFARAAIPQQSGLLFQSHRPRVSRRLQRA